MINKLEFMINLNEPSLDMHYSPKVDSFTSVKPTIGGVCLRYHDLFLSSDFNSVIISFSGKLFVVMRSGAVLRHIS